VSEEVLLTQADRGRDVLLVEATPQATRASAALYRRYRRNGSRAAAAEGGAFARRTLAPTRAGHRPNDSQKDLMG
jgi:hypothetical protein